MCCGSPLPQGTVGFRNLAGTCDLDEKDCRFSHPGEEGAYKNTVCDDDGVCKMEKRRGHCSRDQCPFKHNNGLADADEVHRPTLNCEGVQVDFPKFFDDVM